MKLSKEQIHKVRESLKAGSFSDKWWKALKKEINKCDLSKEDKISVYACIIKGLADECFKLAKNEEDFAFIYCTLDEVLHHE